MKENIPTPTIERAQDDGLIKYTYDDIKKSKRIEFVVSRQDTGLYTFYTRITYTNNYNRTTTTKPKLLNPFNFNKSLSFEEEIKRKITKKYKELSRGY